MIDFQGVIAESYRICDKKSTYSPLFDNQYAIDNAPTMVHMQERQNRTEYGTRLVQARKHSGMCQEELAKKAGISQSTLAAAERRAMGSRYTPMLARALSVHPVWLADGTGPRDVSKSTQFSLIPDAQDAMSKSADHSALALELAALFDELTTRRDRAVGYTRATQALLDVLAQRDVLPSDTPIPLVTAKTPLV